MAGGGLSQADARGGPRAVNSRSSHATSSRELGAVESPGKTDRPVGVGSLLNGPAEGRGSQHLGN